MWKSTTLEKKRAVTAKPRWKNASARRRRGKSKSARQRASLKVNANKKPYMVKHIEYVGYI